MNQNLRVAVRDRNHWHQLRKENIGASEVAALFGASSFMSKFELWHRKKSSDFNTPDNERQLLGRELESGIIRAACQKFGWSFISCDGQYYTHPTIKGMGCTPDGMIIDGEHDGAVGCLEIKNVDFIEFKQKWDFDEPPLSYILQLQHQLAVTGLSYGYIVALVGGNDLRAFRYERDEKAIAKISKAIKEFWQSIHDDVEPDIDAPNDLEVVQAMMRPEEGQQDLTGDNELPDLCAKLKNTSKARLALEKEEKELKARIIKKVGKHTFTFANGFNVSYKKVTRNNAPKPASVSEFYQLTVKELEK